MTVKQLRKILINLPDDMEIIISSDSEGNIHSPLAEVDKEGIYIPESKYRGEVYSADWDHKDMDMTQEVWEEIKSRPRSLILIPTN